MKLLNTTLRRIWFTILPLGVVAILSSNEWVSKAQMIDTENKYFKDAVYNGAVIFNDAVNYVFDFKSENIKDEHLDFSNKEIELISNINQSIEYKNNDYNSDMVELNIEEELLQKNESKLIDNNVIEEKNIIKPKPSKILMVGDSLMNEVAFGFKNNLDKSIKIKDIHKSSTGLTNKDYYDWPNIAKKETKSFQPDIVFIHLGGNDGQDMKEGKKFIPLYSEKWESLYQQRAENLISEIQIASPNTRIVWIGLPGMRDPKYERKTSIIREAQKRAANNKEILYIDGGDAIGKTYSKQKKIGAKMINLRRTDGIHYSREGGEQIAKYSIEKTLN